MKIISLVIFALMASSLLPHNKNLTQQQTNKFEIQPLAVIAEIENSVIYLVHLEKEERKDYMEICQNNGGFFLRAESRSIDKTRSSDNYYFEEITLLHFIPEKIVEQGVNIERYRIESREEFWAFHHDQQTEYESALNYKEWHFVGNSDEDNICAKILNYYWEHQDKIEIIRD